MIYKKLHVLFLFACVFCWSSFCYVQQMAQEVKSRTIKKQLDDMDAVIATMAKIPSTKNALIVDTMHIYKTGDIYKKQKAMARLFSYTTVKTEAPFVTRLFATRLRTWCEEWNISQPKDDYIAMISFERDNICTAEQRVPISSVIEGGDAKTLPNSVQLSKIAYKCFSMQTDAYPGTKKTCVTCGKVLTETKQLVIRAIGRVMFLVFVCADNTECNKQYDAHYDSMFSIVLTAAPVHSR